MIRSIRISTQKWDDQPVEDLAKIRVSKTDLQTLANFNPAADVPLNFQVDGEEGVKEVSAEELANLHPGKPPVEVIDVAVHKADLNQIQFVDQSELQEKKKRLEQQAQQILGEKAEACLRLESEIEDLEVKLREMEAYQEAHGTISELKILKNNLEERLATVKELAQRRQSVGSKIPRDAMNLNEEQLQRIRQRLLEARTPKYQPAKPRTSSNDETGIVVPKLPPQGRNLLVMASITLVAGAAVFWLSSNWLSLIIGIAATVGLLVVYGVYRKIPFKREMSAEDLESENMHPLVHPYKTEDEKEIEKLENMIIQYSQMQILRGELNEIEQQLKDKIGNEDYEQMSQALRDLEDDIADLEAESNEQSKRLNDADALEHRRRLELKRIDRTRLENELVVMPNYGEYLTIKTQQDMLRLSLLELQLNARIYKQITGYSSLRKMNDQIQGLGENGEWVAIELTPEQRSQLSLVSALENWLNSNLVKPVLLVNWESNLPRELRKLLEEYLLQNKEKDAQVLFVDLVD